MLEIEAKARIADDAVSSMRTQLQQLCGNEQPLNKHDTYYRLAVHRDGVAVSADRRTQPLASVTQAFASATDNKLDNNIDIKTNRADSNMQHTTVATQQPADAPSDTPTGNSAQPTSTTTQPSTSPPHERLLRIRTDNDTVYITTKRRTVTDGVEVNREDELTVPLAQHQQCHDFFTQLGAVKYIEKSKIGYRYQYNQYTIELVTVPPLGTFVEIEAVTPPTDEAAIAHIIQGIFDIFKQLSIDNTQIESRKYIELLQLRQTAHS